MFESVLSVSEKQIKGIPLLFTESFAVNSSEKQDISVLLSHSLAEYPWFIFLSDISIMLILLIPRLDMSEKRKLSVDAVGHWAKLVDDFS